MCKKEIHFSRLAGGLRGPRAAAAEVLLAELRRKLRLHDVHDGLPYLVLLLSDRLNLLHLLRHVLHLAGEVLACGGNVLQRSNKSSWVSLRSNVSKFSQNFIANPVNFHKMDKLKIRPKFDFKSRSTRLMNPYLLDVVPGADLDDHLLGVAQLPGHVHGSC